MSVRVAKNRFIVPSLRAAFYQQLLSRVSNFQELGEKAVREAESATDFRDADQLENLALILCNIPIREYQLIGQYYLGWTEYLKGKSDRSIFEEVLEKSQTYKAKACIGLAALEARRGDYTSELKLLTQSLKYANTPSMAIESLRGIATIKAKEGCNKQSLRDLEKMWPLVRHGDLRVYHDYLNSLAVELGEAGRVQEAQAICNIVLASPYAFAYPEWRETANEIAIRGYKSRSAVPVTQKIPGNLLYLPERERETYKRNPFHQPRGITKLADWKKKMVKEPNGDDQIEDLESMDQKDLMVKLLYLTAHPGLTEEKLRKVVGYALKVFSETED